VSLPLRHAQAPFVKGLTCAGAPLRINSYVRIMGSLKTFSNKRSVNCTRVRKIEDMNEINFHLVEVAYTTMYHRKGGQLVSRRAACRSISFKH
jgi:replication factor A2